MTIKTIATCNNCKADIEIETKTETGDDVVCMSCWVHDCKAGVEELAEAKIENTVLKDANAAVCEGLETTRKELRRIEAEKLSAETALTARVEDFIPLMNERLAEAQARIAKLEAELAERDSFEECDAPYDDQKPYQGQWGCSQSYETRVSWHGEDVYHKVGEKRD
jgi:hypothetical protein